MLQPNWYQSANVPAQRYREALNLAPRCFRGELWLQRIPCGSAMSMHPSQSSGHRHVPATRNGYLIAFTCRIFAMRLQTCTNTSPTLRETIFGEGVWYSGLPVFIRLRKPRSFTILKGRLLSETQRTISALREVGKKEWARRLVDNGMSLTWIRLMCADGVNSLLFLG